MCNFAVVMVPWMQVRDAGACVCKRTYTHIVVCCLSCTRASYKMSVLFCLLCRTLMQENLEHQYYSRSCAHYSEKDWAQLKMWFIACTRD
jgi:hypothetical protein